MRHISSPVIDQFKACSHGEFHRHENGYLAIVLSGSYEEFGLEGRFQVEPGMAILHPIYHAHGNRFTSQEGQVLNLPVSASLADQIGYRVMNGLSVPDSNNYTRLDARDFLISDHPVTPINPPTWLGQFVAYILENASVSYAARLSHVTPEHAIRICRSWFGLTPTALRRERKVQKAIQLLKHGLSPSQTAYEVGFSDQPHLTRVLKSAIGFTPGQFKQQ